MNISTILTIIVCLVTVIPSECSLKVLDKGSGNSVLRRAKGGRAGKDGGGFYGYYEPCSSNSDCTDGLSCLEFRSGKGPECCDGTCLGFTDVYAGEDRSPTVPNGEPCLSPDVCLSGNCAGLLPGQVSGTCRCIPAQSNNPPSSNVAPGQSVTCTGDRNTGTETGFTFGSVGFNGCCDKSTDCGMIGEGNGGCCANSPDKEQLGCGGSYGVCKPRYFPSFYCFGDPDL